MGICARSLSIRFYQVVPNARYLHSAEALVPPPGRTGKDKHVIITRTPLRVSFFGGGADDPVWYREHGGAVLSAAIVKGCT
jgi:hypothetical protein